MDNLISRQAAIDAIKGLPTWWADEGGYYGGAQPPMKALLDPTDAVSAIENLPSAQPERKNGKWIVEGEHPKYHLRCSECRKVAMWSNGISYIYPNFCPNCGCAMDEGE